MITRQQLNNYYQALLHPEIYQDDCPNGLQIEGTEQIERIAFAVSADHDSIIQAIEQKADALIVHHGLFWTLQGARPLTGTFAKQVFPLVKNNINLICYHLPLDGHPDIGYAAMLSQLIDCKQRQPFSDYTGSMIGIKGIFKQPLPATALQQKMESILKQDVTLASPNNKALIRSIGIIASGANSEWRQAEKEQLDAYITAEITEHDWHESEETGICILAGGHKTTEKLGIEALMEKTREQFAVDCFFIDNQTSIHAKIKANA